MLGTAINIEHSAFNIAKQGTFLNKALQQFWSAFEKWLPDTSHSIGQWVLLRMALLLIGLGALFLAISIHLLSQRFDAFDAQVYKDEVSRVGLILEQDKRNLEISLADYSRWDDTLAYTQGKQPDYTTTNITGESLTTLGLASIVITSLDATPLFTTALVGEKTLGEMPAKTLAALTPYLKQISQNKPNTLLSNTLWLDGTLYLVAAAPITDSVGKAPTNGYLYMIRSIDHAYIKHFQEISSVAFDLQPSVMRATKETSSKISHKDSAKHWTVTQSIPNLPLQISVSGSTRLFEERRTTYWTLAANAMALVTLSLIGITLILNRRLLRRLSEFSRLANLHRTAHDATIRWPLQGSDELDNLGHSLNDLMGEVSIRHQDLNFLAEHDALTGVGNRRQLHNRLDAVQNRSRRHPGLTSSLLLLDLDDFKLINDGLGHTAGDKVLQIVANRLLELTRNYDTVARLTEDEDLTQLGGNKTVTRLGGDEFAVLLEDSEPAVVGPYAERVLKCLELPIELEGQKLVVRGSIGFTLVDASLSKEDVVRNADLAMYEAKRRGKGRIAMFDAGLLGQASRRLQLELALKQALSNERLEVWFQPIIAADSGDIVGMEALSRWPFDESYIPPMEFIPIAENTGMIAQLGRFVLNEVGATLKDLRKEYPNLQCSVNLSVQQFQDSDLVADISDCLNKYKLPADALKLELTESMIIKHEHDILPTMQQLVEMGCKFYLDDFGTGHSSLDRLRTLPFEVLKIDRSFVTPLNEGDDVMARNIINMGRELGMGLVAEGVETEEELSRLLALGCKNIQGYYFAKPMNLNDLRAWLSAYKKPAKKNLKQMTKKPAKTRASKT